MGVDDNFFIPLLTVIGKLATMGKNPNPSNLWYVCFFSSKSRFLDIANIRLWCKKIFEPNGFTVYLYDMCVAVLYLVKSIIYSSHHISIALYQI